MAGAEIVVSAEADERYLRRLDDAALREEGIARMVCAEQRGVFPLDDASYRRLLTEVYTREEVER